MRLSWDKPKRGTPPTSYKVYKNGTLLTTVPAARTFYSDSNDLTPGMTYVYRVSSVVQGGLESAESLPASVTIPDAEPLTVTLSLKTLTSTSAIVEVEASACSDFRVGWVDTVTGVDRGRVLSPKPCESSRLLTLEELSPETQYLVTATAISEAGESATSRELRIKTPAE